MNSQVDFQTEVEEMTLASIALSRIRPFADQPRKEFNEEELLGLARSIEEIGLQQPISIIPITGDVNYDFELVDGERRCRACKLIGLGHITAFILPKMNKDKQFALSVVSNFCRVGHTSMETAVALQIIVDGFIKNGIDGEHLSKDECIERAAKICGRGYAWGVQHLSLLRLCPEVQNHLVSKRISFQVGIALTGLKDEFQLRFIRHIISSELDHRQALAYIRGQRSPDVVSHHGRIRKPADDYAIILRGVKKASSELDMLLDISMKKIKEACNSRSTQEVEKIITGLKDLSNQAKLFAENLESAKK
jgi:ParB family chromosome partitioning protein